MGTDIHFPILMLPFYKLVLRFERPAIQAPEPQETRTIGDHLRKRRLGLNLSKQDVACYVGASARQVSDWESNQATPRIRLIPKIIEFLGYKPFPDPARSSQGDQIVAARQLLGLSQADVARQLGISETAVYSWEHDRKAPSKSLMPVLQAFIDSAYRVGMTEGQSEQQLGAYSSSQHPAAVES